MDNITHLCLDTFIIYIIGDAIVKKACDVHCVHSRALLLLFRKLDQFLFMRVTNFDNLLLVRNLHLILYIIRYF